MTTDLKKIESFFTKPLLEALYQDYLWQWSQKCFFEGLEKDETVTVKLWLFEGQFIEEELEKIPWIFLIHFFDKEDPFVFTSKGKLGYSAFARAFYVHWLTF